MAWLRQWAWAPVALLILGGLWALSSEISGVDAFPGPPLAGSESATPTATAVPSTTPLAAQQVAGTATPSSWQAPQNVSNDPRASEHPSIAIEPSLVLHLVWDDYTASLGGTDNRIVYASKPVASGTNWTAAADVSGDPGAAVFPVIRIDEVRSVFQVLWGRDQVVRAQRKPGGGWERPVNVFEPGRFPAAAIDRQDGTLHVVWEAMAPERQGEILWSQVPFNAIPPSDPVNISRSAATSSTQPVVAVDGLRTVHAVWTEFDSLGRANLFYAFKPFGGDWQPPAPISSGRSPSLDVDYDGTLHLAFVDQAEDPRSTDIFYAFKRSTAGWSGRENVSRSSALSETPALLEDDGDIHVVWQDDSLGNPEILHAAKRRGEEWSGLENVSRSRAIALYPALTVDGFKNLHVVWQDNRFAGSPEVFYSTNAPPPPPTATPTPTPTPTTPPSLRLSTNQLVFFIPPEDLQRNPTRRQPVIIFNQGGAPMTWTATRSNVPWLAISPSASLVPVPPGGQQSLLVAVDSSRAGVGEFVGQVTVDAPGAPNTPQVVTVVLRVGAIPAQNFFPIAGRQ